MESSLNIDGMIKGPLTHIWISTQLMIFHIGGVKTPLYYKTCMWSTSLMLMLMWEESWLWCDIGSTATAAGSLSLSLSITTALVYLYHFHICYLGEFFFTPYYPPEPQNSILGGDGDGDGDGWHFLFKFKSLVVLYWSTRAQSCNCNGCG